MPSASSPGPAWTRGLVSVALLAAIAWLALGRGAGLPPLTRDPPAPADRPLASYPLPDAPALAGITGTVRTAAAAPLAGAQVCAFPAALDVDLGTLLRPTCTLSDAAGAYTITTPSPGPHTVHASAAHHMPAAWRGPGVAGVLDLRPGHGFAGIDLALVPGGARVDGLVRDRGGRVVAGALIVNYVVESGVVTPGPYVAARSDAAGRFTMWLDRGSFYVSAQADGFADADAWGQAPDEVELALIPESVLLGRVVEAGSERPIAGATIRLRDESSPVDHALHGATSDSAGRFVVDRLRPGRYHATAVAPGLYGESAGDPLLPLGETVGPIVMRLQPAARVTGRVRFAGSGAACPMGQVSVGAGRHTSVADIHADGLVHFPALLPGEYGVSVSCPGGAAPLRYPTFTVADADVDGLVWEVRGGAVIRGRVVDAHGDPIDGVRVDAHPGAQPDGDGDERTGATSRPSGADGSFELPPLPPGDHALFVPDLVDPRAVPRTVKLGDRDLDGVHLVARPGGGLRGVVVDAGGQPVADARVDISITTTTTDRDGRFELRRLPERDYTPHVTRGDMQFGWRDKNPEEHITDGEVLDVRLVIRDELGEIRGLVRDPDGAAVTDAYVQAARATAPGPFPSGYSDSEWTDALHGRLAFSTPILVDPDGRFTLRGLASAHYFVRAAQRGGGEVLLGHVARGDEVVLVLPPDATLAGRVRDAPDRFDLELSTAERGGVRRESFFRSDGRWRLEGLSPGSYRLRVTCASGAIDRAITVHAGEVRDDLELVLQPPGIVRGRVIDVATGAAVPGLRVTSARPGEDVFADDAPGVLTDAAGRFTLTGLLPGQLLVAAQSPPDGPPYRGVQSTTTVVSGATIDVDLEITADPGARVQGIVPAGPAPADHAGPEPP